QLPSVKSTAADTDTLGSLDLHAVDITPARSAPPPGRSAGPGAPPLEGSERPPAAQGPRTAVPFVRSAVATRPPINRGTSLHPPDTEAPLRVCPTREALPYKARTRIPCRTRCTPTAS